MSLRLLKARFADVLIEPRNVSGIKRAYHGGKEAELLIANSGSYILLIPFDECLLIKELDMIIEANNALDRTEDQERIGTYWHGSHDALRTLKNGSH